MNGRGEPTGIRVVGELTPAIEATLGSVPGWFRPAEEAPVVLVNAGGEWVDAVWTALAGGAAAVLVERPHLPSDAELDRLAGEPVVLVGRRTHAPQVRSLAAELAPLAAGLAWVDVLVVEGAEEAGSPELALWEAVAMLTAAGIVLDSVPRVRLGPGVVIAEASAGPALVHLTCLARQGAASRAGIKAFGADWSVEAAMGDPEVASPGQVLRVTAAGAAMATTSYETPRRVALREAHSRIAGRLRAGPGTLNDHACVIRLLNQVAWADSRSATHLKWKETD